LQNQLEFLRQLQKIDSAISKIESSRSAYPNKIKQLEKELERKNQREEKDKVALEEIQKARSKKEQSLKMEGERLKKSQERLFSVKTNKEYQAALKEIDDVKQICNDLETEILIFMEKADALARTIETQERENREWMREFEKKKEMLETEIQKSDLELQYRKKMRLETLERVAPDLVKKYDTLLQKRQGLAVVSIEDGNCRGCNMQIPPQKILEIRKGTNTDIASCPFCNRIIYFDEGSAGRE
jgi:hypothetical protein